MTACFPAPAWPRRRWLAGMAGTAGLSALGLGGALVASPAHALTPRTLQFPRDFGSHPDLRTEWWYITGQASVDGKRLGFQVTFFRSRVDATQGLTSAFAARQLLFAHAAVTDVRSQKLWHDQRIARAGFGIAEASTEDTRIRLGDWSLVRENAPASAAIGAQVGDASRYLAKVAAQDFDLALSFTQTQPLLLQGTQGLSRKGPEVRQASYYYSQPQLAVAGHIRLGDKHFELATPAAGARPGAAGRGGKAWLDHECSEAVLHPEATGWDWIGMNLEDGSALTAFRLRRQDGTALWAGGSFRAAASLNANAFGPDEVVFTPVRYWQSPLGATYPVEWRVATPVGTFTVRAVLNDQELDSRASTGAIYWEGLSDLLDSQGTTVGQGYLEMTGYAAQLRL